MFNWKICSGLMVQQSDFHAQYIFMEGLELANLDMVQCSTSVTDTPRSVVVRRVSNIETAHVWLCTDCDDIWRWGCEVSDDTVGVIMPTSVSDLQHEKDTFVTQYMPPTILRCPSFCAVLLSPSYLNQNQTVYQITKGFCHNVQSNERGSIYSFLVPPSMPPLVRNFTQWKLYVFHWLVIPPFCQRMMKW